MLTALGQAGVEAVGPAILRLARNSGWEGRGEEGRCGLGLGSGSLQHVAQRDAESPARDFCTCSGLGGL